MSSASTIERATVVPWIVDVEFERAARLDPGRLVQIVEAPMQAAPSPEDIVEPLGALRVIRADIFPATMFDEMSRPARLTYRHHYRFFQLWQRAKARGKSASDMVAWADYDPIFLASQLDAWLYPAAIWTGG